MISKYTSTYTVRASINIFIGDMLFKCLYDGIVLRTQSVCPGVPPVDLMCNKLHLLLRYVKFCQCGHDKFYLSVSKPDVSGGEQLKQ